MNRRDMIDMALRNLWKRRLRTALTVLGVVIGTASIVVMVSIGIGMNKGFASQHLFCRAAKVDDCAG